MNDVELEWGPAFIGSVFCMSLFGITLAQTLFYFLVFSNDTLDLKILVSSLCALDTFHIYLLCSTLWTVLLRNRADTVDLVFEVPWELLASSAVAYFVTFVVQIFFAVRVWRVFGKRWLLVIVITITAAVQLGSGMAFVVYNTIQPRSQDNFSDQTGITELASSCACDLAITASLLYYFYSSRVGIKSTDAVLDNLIVLTINTGLAPAVVTTVALALYEAPIGSYNAFPSHFILSKLHVNCLLATLNARKHIRELANKDFSYTLDDIPEMPGSSQGTNETNQNTLADA